MKNRNKKIIKKLRVVIKIIRGNEKKYKIFVDNIFGNIPLTYKIWKNKNLKELKIDDGFARAIGFNSLEDMKNKVGESVIKSIGYFPEWTILEETDPLNNIVLN